MGRLNYQARKIEGAKAGQVVAKDLMKRITPGVSAKAAARDPTVELDVASKHLTDVGFAQFIDVLAECIMFRDEDHPDGAVKLADLNLQGNKLSAKSLPKLAEVVTLSAGDLREMDISKNNIRVATPEEKAAWETFLWSFRHCYMLKKLDLGENPLGIAGIEILARIYIQSDLDYLEGDSEAMLRAKLEPEASLAYRVESIAVKDMKENNPIRSHSRKRPTKLKTPKANGRVTSTQLASRVVSQADLKRYACTRGLRSIPYLIISNTCKTNADAIHLSSMMGMQRPSEQLLAFLPAGKAPTLPRDTGHCKGIIWLPNDELDVAAQRMIEIEETVRQLSTSDSDDEDKGGSDYGHLGEQVPDKYCDAATRRKLQKKLETEYARLTKRVRMDALKRGSVHDVEIWSIAVRMMVASRALLLEDRDRLIDLSTESSASENASTGERDGRNDEQGAQGRQEKQDLVDIFPEDQKYEGFPSVTRVACPFDLTIDEYNAEFPALYVSKHSSGVEVRQRVEAGNITPGISILGPQISAGRSPRGHSRVHPNPNAPLKQNWRAGLPMDLWRRIIADAVGAKGILCQSQQERIMRYASDWNVLAYKLTITGVEDYQQIWKFLQTVGCFTYSSQS